MADDQTIINEAKNVITTFLSDVQNHNFTKAADTLHNSLIIIKPEGKLANKNSWVNMISSSDIRIVTHKLLLWNFTELSSSKDMFYCGYTTKFSFNIIQEDETYTEKGIFTALLKKTDDTWKIHYLQRTDDIDSTPENIADDVVEQSNPF